MALLSVAQHYGLPTRLLDWTFSPYVAAHFATEELGNYDRDGAIWCAKVAAAHRGLPQGLQQQLDFEGSFVFTTQMLAAESEGLPQFDVLSSSPFVAFFEPPSLDQRIVNQWGAFSVVSSPVVAPHEVLEELGALRKVIIPAGKKWEIRNKLDQANITERVLFPGLDGLSRMATTLLWPGACLRPASLTKRC